MKRKEVVITGYSAAFRGGRNLREEYNLTWDLDLQEAACEAEYTEQPVLVGLMKGIPALSKPDNSAGAEGGNVHVPLSPAKPNVKVDDPRQKAVGSIIFPLPMYSGQASNCKCPA